MKDNKQAKDPGQSKPRKPDQDTPAAGPHAKKSLTDKEKTPGTGSLPDPEQPGADVGPD